MKIFQYVSGEYEKNADSWQIKFKETAKLTTGCLNLKLKKTKLFIFTIIIPYM